MKNLFLLPTDKPSRLWMTKLGNLTRCHDIKPIKEALGNNVNIYITSGEEIKEENLTKSIYVIDVQNGNIGKLTCKNSFFKDSSKLIEIEWSNKQNIWNYYHIREIILTTDIQLIQDGVQAIDDDFLEWFVKNPTCERFEVIYELNINGKNGLDRARFVYKIIIPKEEQNNKLYSEQYIYEKDLYNDKVEISVLALIEIKRAFGALIKDENSYVHKVFMDDYVHHALRELKSTYAEYFDEQIKDW